MYDANIYILAKSSNHDQDKRANMTLYNVKYMLRGNDDRY